MLASTEIFAKFINHSFADDRDAGIAFAIADIFTTQARGQHGQSVLEVVDPLTSSQGRVGHLHAPALGVFSGSSPIYRIVAPPLRGDVAGTYEVTNMVQGRKLFVWIRIRWSWIIFILCIINGIVHVVGVRKPCPGHDSGNLR